jgi:hypothetical protein
VRRLSLTFLLGILITAMSCGGGGGGSTPQASVLSGNWQFTITGQVLQPFALTGFLTQSGNSVTGSLVSVSSCPGVTPITGTVSGQSVTFSIDQFGENISLNGTLPSGTTPLGGDFTSLAGVCQASADAGTWSAVQVTPIAGSFQGSFTSRFGNGTVSVTGTLSQGPNTGESAATLSGTMEATSGTAFCAYLSSETVTGLISGTAVSLNLYGVDGLELTQLGNLGNSPTVTVTPDGTSITGPYLFPAISSSCPADQGTFQLTFP